MIECYICGSQTHDWKSGSHTDEEKEWLSMCEYCEHWDAGKRLIVTIKHAWHWLWCTERRETK